MARPRSFDEAEVLRAARDQFWAGGYAATSLGDVMAATGLGKGSLYAAFGDKRDLYLRVFDEYCTDVVRGTERALGPGRGDAWDRLCAYVRGVAESTADDTAHRGCLLANGPAELSGKDEAVRDRARVALERLEDLLVACIAEAQGDGRIDADADARQLGALLLAVLRGVEALGKAGRDPASLRAVAETAIGLLPRP